MEILKKAGVIVLSIILLEGPQLYTVDAIELKKKFDKPIEKNL
ncbi:MAG: hypothetical protein RSD47_08685 [Romboutsia sp.]